MIYILIFFVSIAVLASVVLVSLIVNRFLRSIKKLQGAALRVSEGAFSLRLDDISSYNEINDVGLAFNMMIDQVKKSRKEIEQKVEKQTQSLVKNKTDLENQQKAILNILEDVEEEKAGSTRLAGELEKFRLAVDNASDHIVITDLDGIVIHANKAVERITGYSLDSIIGQKAGKLWGGLMGKPFYDKLWKTIKKDKKIFTGEIKNRRKGGEEYVAEVSISPVLDSKKNVQFFLGIERDISERKEAEDQVRKVLNDMQEQAQVLAGEKAKDEALLENIGDGIISTNQDGVVTMVNNAALEMLKYDEKDVIEKSVMDVINIVDEKDKPINMAHHPMVLALSTGEKTTTPLGTTYYYVRKDGTKFAAGITVTPFVWQGKIVGTILVFRDITVEKEIDQMKTEFVSLASHQLRTPLSTINWYAEMLLSGDAGKITKDQKEYLQEIYTGNQRMVELVNSLLNVSRIELGTFAVDPEPTDMKEMAESVFGELKPQIAEKGIQITKKYDKKIGKISLDTKLMRIVFQNLLTNAVKYTGEKGEIGLEIKRRAKDIMVTVSDNGFGIPKKQQAQIFTKMFRADNVKAKDTTGTGLGLYIIKSIIEQSASGKIWFESQENKGTTFYFTIPLTGMVKKEGSKALT
ncbi:hypothetical protein C0581_02505 [Candidatus Parcubacteria bacterium]|nr:MAG: hypothetical protein C0581_02505 [Candidatus Parcubacteria bacterium]